MTARLRMLRCFLGIVWREGLRFLSQRSRFFAALVRPLIWLFDLRRGLPLGARRLDRAAVQTYILYDEYVDPRPGRDDPAVQRHAEARCRWSTTASWAACGCCLTSPMPRWFLLICQAAGGHAAVAAAGLCVPADRLALRHRAAAAGLSQVLPALLLVGMMLGALGLLLSSMIKQLENFAGVMNFIIFPMFFTSSALYPLWKVEEASPILRDICGLNPFTYAVELVRFALYGQFDTQSLLDHRPGWRLWPWRLRSGVTTAAASCAARSARPDRS